MTLSEDAKWLIQNAPSWVIVLLGSVIAFLALMKFLGQKTNADKARDSALLEMMKTDSQQWRDAFSYSMREVQTAMTSTKVGIEGLGLVFSELLKTIKEDRITTMAYQNTTSSALSGLVVNVQHLMGLPAGMKNANDTLGQISKGQRIQLEESSRNELELKKELAKTNNALADMQREVKKLATAMNSLPDTMKATLSPLVVMMERVLSTAQETQAKIDDLPLVAHENKVVEKDLLEANGNAPHPLTPSPLHGEGELNQSPALGETVVAE